MSDKRGRGWPISIVIIFIFLSFMLFGILYISFKYAPVNHENVYQMGYQEVDKNFNDIHDAQLLFDQAYRVRFDMNKLSPEPVETMRVNGDKIYFDHAFRLGENRFAVDVSDRDGHTIDDATVSLLVTRYDTSEFDHDIKVSTVEAGRYTSEPFEIKHEGRWKIVAKVTVGDQSGYFEKSVYAR